MKHTFTALFLAIIASSAFGQNLPQTVLKHIEPAEASESYNYWGQTLNGSPGWGYTIGHNLYNDEAFGEKYNINQPGEVLGVIAHYTGKTASSGQIHYKVYSENASGLPGSSLGQKSFAFQDVPTDGSAHTVMFDNPVSVDEDFFVVLDLGDYTHDPLQGDTLCLLSGEDGSRPASDDEFGRNAIRWHDHNSENWKDFFTQNFTPISTYFAIYPIMDGQVASVSGVFVDDAAPVIYPLPAQEKLNIDVNLLQSRDITLRIISMAGRELRTEVFGSTTGSSTLRLDISDLAAGSYILAMESGKLRQAQIITKE